MPQPSFFLTLAAHVARGWGDRPEAVAMLRAYATVEQKYGLARTLSAALTAYSSGLMTLAANGATDIDAAVVTLTELLSRATAIRDALRDGRPIPNMRIVGTAAVPADTSAAWGRKGGAA